MELLVLGLVLSPHGLNLMICIICLSDVYSARTLLGLCHPHLETWHNSESCKSFSLLLFLVELYYIHQAYPATVSVKHQLVSQKPYVRLGTPRNQKSIK